MSPTSPPRPRQDDAANSACAAPGRPHRSLPTMPAMARQSQRCHGRPPTPRSHDLAGRRIICVLAHHTGTGTGIQTWSLCIQRGRPKTCSASAALVVVVVWLALPGRAGRDVTLMARQFTAVHRSSVHALIPCTVMHCRPPTAGGGRRALLRLDRTGDDEASRRAGEPSCRPCIDDTMAAPCVLYVSMHVCVRQPCIDTTRSQGGRASMSMLQISVDCAHP